MHLILFSCLVPYTVSIIKRFIPKLINYRLKCGGGRHEFGGVPWVLTVVPLYRWDGIIELLLVLVPVQFYILYLDNKN